MTYSCHIYCAIITSQAYERGVLMSTDFYEITPCELCDKFPFLWKKIGSHGVMTLSTCSHSRVTSRPMSVVVINGKFYCQTDINFLKCRQKKENLNTALSFKNFSIEGRCKIMDKPVMHSGFIKAMTEHFPSAVTRYSGLDTERMLEITPTLIYLWEYENDKPYMEYYDFRNDTYRKVEM